MSDLGGSRTRTEPGKTGWTRSERVLFIVFVATILVCSTLLVRSWYVPYPDASLYIVTARSLLAGEGYSHLGEPFVVRPPGFSLLIAPILAFFGTDFSALNLLVSLFGVASVTLLALQQRERLGLFLAVCVSVTFWCNPDFRRLNNTILSDVPGLAALLLGLLLDSWSRRGAAWPREVVLGVTLGLIAYLRFVNILLVPAILASRLLSALRSESLGESGWSSFALRRLALPTLCAALVIAPWLWRDSIARSSTAVDQTLLHSYATAMWRVDWGDPNSEQLGWREVAQRVPLRSMQIAVSLGSRLHSDFLGQQRPRSEDISLRLAMAAALLASSLVMLRRRAGAAEIFVWINLALLSVYFGFEKRLLLPIYALTLPALVAVLRDLASAAAGRRLASALTVVALGCLAVVELRAWDEPEDIRRRHAHYQEVARSLPEGLPSSARLASAMGLNYSVYLERPVFGLKLAMRRAADPEEALERTLDRYGIHAVLLSPWLPRERSLIPYFEERYGSGEKAGPARLWRVRP